MTTAPIPSPSRPWLVADIHDTRVRFGYVIQVNGQPRRMTTLRCTDHPTFAAAAEAYLGFSTDMPRPHAACVVVSGPVDAERLHVPAANWDCSLADTARTLKIRNLEWLNDFSALTLATPHLSERVLRLIGPARRKRRMPLAVISPGRTLKVAGLLPHGDGWIPVHGKGRHATVMAQSELELAIAKTLRSQRTTVSASSVLSTPGLARLHQCLSTVYGIPTDELTPDEIYHRGRQRNDSLCVQVLNIFCGLLGSFAGNVALTLGADGGVIFGGELASALHDLLATSDFRRRFEDNALGTDYLRGIATEVIVAPAPALHYAAARLAQQQSNMH